MCDESLSPVHLEVPMKKPHPWVPHEQLNLLDLATSALHNSLCCSFLIGFIILFLVMCCLGFSLIAHTVLNIKKLTALVTFLRANYI